MHSAAAKIISQRSFLGGPEFRFNDDQLEYCGVQWDFRTRYADIAAPSQYRRSKTSDQPVRFTFFFLILLALAVLSRDHNPHYGSEGLYWLLKNAGGFAAILAAICVPLHYLLHREFTIIPTRNGNLIVFRDRQHDAIVERLQAERLKSLRQLAAPNPANSPHEELAKLKWLHEEGALTEDEYPRFCSQVAT